MYGISLYIYEYVQKCDNQNYNKAKLKADTWYEKAGANVEFKILKPLVIIKFSLAQSYTDLVLAAKNFEEYLLAKISKITVICNIIVYSQKYMQDTRNSSCLS